MDSQMNPNELHFGLEIEIFVKPKKRSLLQDHLNDHRLWGEHIATNDLTRAGRDNRKAIRESIADLLNTCEINATAAEMKEEADHTVWSIVEEPALDQIPELDGFWRLEIVSRVLSFNSDWKGELEGVFGVLKDNCELQLSRGCATHVHVSPSNVRKPPFTLDQLKKLLKAIAYYDEPITKVMPPERKVMVFAESSFQGANSVPKLNKHYLEVHKETWAPLFRIFDDINSIRDVHSTLGNRRLVSWSFQYVDTHEKSDGTQNCGTVEFRRPPGVKTAEDAEFWAEFALFFTAAAFETDWTELAESRTYPTVKDLASFLVSGHMALGLANSGSFDFNRITEDSRPPTVLTKAESASIEKYEKAKSEKGGSFFAKKATSQPNTPRSSPKSSPSSSYTPPGSQK